MTTYYDMAKQIPSDCRNAMLEGNYIFKAVAREDDADMVKLFVLYRNFIEPNNEVYKYENGKIKDACQLCLTNILDKFKLLEPYLILLEKESKLIEA